MGVAEWGAGAWEFELGKLGTVTAQWVPATSEEVAGVCVWVAGEESNYEHQIKLIYMD